MTETLTESYDRCRNANYIMGDIIDSLSNAGMTHRVNKKQTEIVVDAKKQKVTSVLEAKGICTDLFDFLIFMKEQKKKTYIRLRYN